MPVHIEELQTDIELQGEGASAPASGAGPTSAGLERVRGDLRQLVAAELERAYETWRRARR